ncbi:hypothetical protein CF319_g8005 [Tilletia indica]|nr:hypothetical protein CF319_g8005 [Tilletia indica]
MYDSTPPTQTPNASPVAELHFLNRTVFHMKKEITVNDKAPPLSQDTRRFGNVVALPPAAATGTGTGYRSHVPLHARIRINGTDNRAVPTLIDTGASLSTVDAEVLRRLGGVPQGRPMKVSGLGSMESLGWVTLTFFLDATDPAGKHVHLEFSHDFHVLPDFAPGFCLGLDFISVHDVTITAARGRGCINRYTFDVAERLPGPYSQELKLVVENDTVVEAGTQAWIPVGAGALAPGIDYAVFPRLSVSPDETVRLAGPAALMTHKHLRHILIGNYGTVAFTIARGTIMADACAAHVGDRSVSTSHTFHLRPELPPSAQSFTVSPDTSAEDDVPDPEAAMPLDAFEEVEPPGSSLVQDAATVLVDDLFRVGAEQGQSPPPELVELLRSHREAFALDGRPGRVKGFEMDIQTQPDVPLRPEAPRRASPEKRAAMDSAIDQLLDWDVIEESRSPISFPVHMVRQYGKWRFCVDYRQHNAATIPNRYPLPTIDSIFQTLCGKKWFSALDAIRGYHQLGVREEDRWKTAFVCHRGLFQYKMVPFGLRNAPAIFQRLMDHILGPLRWNQAVVYIDDAVVATDTLEEHLQALGSLLQSATDAGLKFSPSKCTFGVHSLTLLGRKVSGSGIAVWRDRAQAVQDLLRPSSLQELFHVLGLFGYYRAFVPGFAEKAAPLTKLLRGWKYEQADGRTRLVNTEGKAFAASKVSIPWEAEQQTSFDTLKDAISSPPTLAHPDPERPYLLYVDASTVGFGAVLHQVNVDERVREVAAPLSVAHAHHMSIPVMPPRLARDRWRAWLEVDRFFGPLLRQVVLDGASQPDWVLKDGLLVRRSDDRLALPDGALPTLLRAVHDNRGHFGFSKTLLALRKYFWRPDLSTAVRAWVKHCPVCQRTKAAPKTGSLDVQHDPQLPFEHISVDQIFNLPRSQAGNDSAIIILDVFSRMVLITPCHKDITAEGITAIISDRVLRMGWLPRRITTDSEYKVAGSVMTALSASLNADLTPSPPYHQQANKVERAVQTVQHVLQALCVNSRAHWDRRVVPAAELALNSTPSISTGYRPFDLIFVSHPSIVHAVFDSEEHLGVSSFEERLAAAVDRLQDARLAIEESRAEQKRRYDARHARPPVFTTGDWVHVRLTDRPIPGFSRDKLDPRKAGPFQVAEVVSPHRVRLSLPADIAVDPVFSTEQVDLIPRGDPFAADRLPISSSVPVGDDVPVPVRSASPPRDDPPVSSVSTTSRIRQPPVNLRDFHVGALHSKWPKEVEDALRFPIHRPRRVDVGDRSFVLVERPVAFLSRLTSPAEKKLAASELELCCLAWAFGKLAHLLEGAQVTVITDHAPMERMLQSTANVPYGPTISRCRALMMPHLPNLRFQYRPGPRHINADALSRLPSDQGRSASIGGRVLDETLQTPDS